MPKKKNPLQNTTCASRLSAQVKSKLIKVTKTIIKMKFRFKKKLAQVRFEPRATESEP